MEIVDLKKTMSAIKNLLARLNGGMEVTEGRVDDLEAG